MRSFGIARFLLAAIALAAAVAQGPGSHAHALAEIDLAPHAVMSVEGAGDCGPLQHLESATPHRHPACGSCTLASTPSSGAVSVALLGATTPVALPPVAGTDRPFAAAAFARGPARAPPLS